MYLIFAILGALAGPVMAVGDMLLDLKGKDNKQYGKLSLINSAWNHMNEKRFRQSIVLAMFGTPMQAMGMLSMAKVLSESNTGFALAFFVVCLFGITGSFFIHTVICLFPVIYKNMITNHTLEETDAVINSVYHAVSIPFWIQYCALVAFPGFFIIAALFLGYLPLSPLFGLITAPVLTLFGLTLRKLFPNIFYDLPGIVMPSLGVGSIGLLALLSMI